MTIKYGVLAFAAAGALAFAPLALAQDAGMQPMTEEPMASPSDEMQAPEQQASLDPSMSEPSAAAQGQSPFAEEFVRGIQQALKDQGEDVQVDGVWGPETQAALGKYQQQEGIDAQGQINMETLSSLEVEDEQGSQQAAAPSEEMPSESEQQAAAPSEEMPSETEQQAAAPSEEMPSETEQQATAPTEPPSGLEAEQQATAPGAAMPSESQQQATAPTTE